MTKEEWNSFLGPPRLSPEAHLLEKVIPEGSQVQLPCPVEGGLFFEWHRGQQPFNIFYEDRFRVQSNGALHIRSARPQDSGLYVCRAVNGFGKVDANVTLVVLAFHFIKHNVSFNSKSNQRQEEREIPILLNVTRPSNGHLSRPVGGSVRLLCKADGQPQPQVTWLKNGQPLHSSMEWKRSRWSLYIRSLQEDDQGNYTCIAYNFYGHVNHTFILDVIPGDRQKPELRGIHPVNKSVEEGGSAVFQCRVKSQLVPHVQWLKQTDPNEGAKVIKIDGEYLKILQSSQLSERSDGSFVTQLSLTGVSKEDAGKYVCLGANTVGYSFRSAFLTIRGGSVDNGPIDDLSLPLFITISVTLAVLFLLLAIAFFCYYPKLRPPTVPNVVPKDAAWRSHSALESSDVPSIVSAQTDFFSECDSSFVFLNPNILCKNALYSPNNPG